MGSFKSKEKGLRWNKSKYKVVNEFFLVQTLSIFIKKIEKHLTWQFMLMTSQLNWIVQMFYYSKSVFSNQYSTFYYSRSIYLAIFESNLNYCSLVWAQNSSVFFFFFFNNFFFLLNCFFTTTRIIWLKVTIKKNNYMNQLLRSPLLKYTRTHTHTHTHKNTY